MQNTVDITELEKLEFYMLMSNGRYYRAKGYMGSGETWVSDIKKAKIWQKSAPAKSAQTYFSDEKYLKAGFPIPTIVKMTPGKIELIDDHNRIFKSQLTKLKNDKKRYMRYLHGILTNSSEHRKYSNEIAKIDEQIKSIELKLI